MLMKLIALKEAYLNKEDGATAIEYGLIAGFIAIGIVAGVTLMGDSLETMFNTIGADLDAASKG